MRRRVLLAGAAGLAGCSVLPARPYQERREWPLDVKPPPAPPGGAGAGHVLLVRSLRAAPGLDTRGLRSMTGDGAERIDYWEEWAVPPPQAVEEDLRRWLAASGRFAAVIEPGSQVPYDLVLEGELLALAADLRTGQARAAMSLVLLRHTGGRTVPLLQQTFDGTAPLRGPGAPAQVDAMRAAVAAMLRGAVGVVAQA